MKSMYPALRGGPRRSPRRAPGFTLVELLVVIAIIGVLVALVLPGITSAQQRARQVACASNLRQLNIGLVGHLQDRRDHIPFVYAWSNARPLNE